MRVGNNAIDLLETLPKNSEARTSLLKVLASDIDNYSASKVFQIDESTARKMRKKEVRPLASYFLALVPSFSIILM